MLFRSCRETSLGNAPRIACLTAQGLRLGACLTCWGVLDACVRGCDPFAPDALTACCAGFCFGLRDDTALVDWATLDLGLDFCLAGWDLVARTERLLPTEVVSSLLASPTVCVCCAGASKGGVVVPSSRAITSLSQRIITP